MPWNPAPFAINGNWRTNKYTILAKNFCFRYDTWISHDSILRSLLLQSTWFEPTHNPIIPGFESDGRLSIFGIIRAVFKLTQLTLSRRSGRKQSSLLVKIKKLPTFHNNIGQFLSIWSAGMFSFCPELIWKDKDNNDIFFEVRWAKMMRQVFLYFDAKFQFNIFIKI